MLTDKKNLLEYLHFPKELLDPSHKYEFVDWEYIDDCISQLSKKITAWEPCYDDYIDMLNNPESELGYVPNNHRNYETIYRNKNIVSNILESDRYVLTKLKNFKDSFDDV